MARSKAEILDELAAVSAELQLAETLAKRRDELVIEATRADASRSEVGRAAGVSRGRVQQIVSEERERAETRTKRTHTKLAVIALVAGLGAAWAIWSAGNDASVTDPASQGADALSYSQLQEADVEPHVKWLASAMVKEARSPFAAQDLEFFCDGISDTQAQAMSELLKHPITDESLSALNSTCPKH